MNNELKKYLAGETMDEKCNCGVDHGSAEKNIAPSVVEGDEKASEEAVSAQDAAVKTYLAMCEDDGAGVRKHADGSVCEAKSPESCPFNKKAEAGEKAITGEEKAKDDSKPFEVDKDRLHKALSNRGVENRGIWGYELYNDAKSPLGVQKWDADSGKYVDAKELLMRKLGDDEDSQYIKKCLDHERAKESKSFSNYLDRYGTANE